MGENYVVCCVFTYAPHIIGAITLAYSGGGTPEIIIIERVGGSSNVRG